MKKNLPFIAAALMAMLIFILPGRTQFAVKSTGKPNQAELSAKDDAELLWGLNWEEPQLSTDGIINALFGGLPEPGHVVTADDIVVPEGKVWTITSIWARGFLSVDELGNPWALPNGFGVRVYSDDNDNPGDLIIDYMVESIDFDPTQPEIDFSTPLELSEGKYWVAVYGYFANSTISEEGRWNQYMWNPEPPIGSEARIRDYADMFGMEVQGWMLLEEDLSIYFTALDFAVWGTEADEAPEIFTVTFNVQILIPGFNPDLHEVYIAGSFGGDLNWVEPGTNPALLMERIDDTMIFAVTLEVEAGECEYKYFSTFVGEGWYGSEMPGGDNRVVTVDGDMVLNDFWYRYIYKVIFYLDMGNAENFNPDLDEVYITGSMFDWAEPGSDLGNQTMIRIDDSMIWKKTLYIPIGVYQYKYFLNEGWDGAEWADAPDRQVTIIDYTIIENTWGVPADDTYINLAEPGKAQLYPNPAVDDLTISANSTINRIRIIDITGRIVYNQRYNHSTAQILVDSFEAGLYVVQVYTRDGLMTRKLILKNGNL